MLNRFTLGLSALLFFSGLSFAQEANLKGGLIVHLGANQIEEVATLSRTGKFLIHLLDPNPDKTAAARKVIHKEGLYGLAWAETLPTNAPLPYAENVVNQITVNTFAVDTVELTRVLTPGGRLVIRQPNLVTEADLVAAGFEAISTNTDGSITARKIWPKTMDQWSHARHAADGNAVSCDTEVGPPQRVRWVAAATWEVEGMVSAGGRNFYGGILARDSFNGLRLWHRDLAKGGDPNATEFKLPRLPRNGARPVASSELLFAIVKGKPVALDASTGEIKVDFSGVESPNSILNFANLLVVAGPKAIHGFDADSGKETWKVHATEPHNVIAGNGLVSLIHGRPKRGEKSEAITLDANTGDILWRRNDLPWLDRVTRTVLHEEHLAFEVSTFNDHDAGNGLHIVLSRTGEFAWEKSYPPGMNHARQARALFLDDALWILHGGKLNTATPDKLVRQPTAISALELSSGEVMVTHKAGMAHCFPPVATPNYMFSGELDLTNLRTGDVVANRITKANCSRENGWVPANGLVYTTPKHCTCWPMLRGFVAMAPAHPTKNPAKLPLDQIEFIHEAVSASRPESIQPSDSDWPTYRGDVWRSGSSSQAGPIELEVAWKAPLSGPCNAKAGPILHDWSENPYIKGPLTAPVIANGLAYVARPDAHELLAVRIDGSGEIVWRVTVNGRIDGPPTIYNGLALFGTHAGWVHGLRADTGETVWKFRAAPTSERIVAYGQVESPWPVPGSVLVDEGVAYFVAGRQELADGGVFVFAVDPMTGKKQWVHRIDDVPQKGFYENSGLEFDPVDILHREGNRIAMSRWLVDRDGSKSSVDKWNAFARLDVEGKGAAWVPRGFWTYGARHQYRFAGEAPKRPLCAYRDGKVLGQLNGSTDIYLRDFDLENGEDFESKWITGWKASGMARKGEKPYRSHRIAENAKWQVDPFAAGSVKREVKIGAQVWNEVYGIVVAGNERGFLVHKDGRLKTINLVDGNTIAEITVPNPVWDSLILANGQLFLTTVQGELVCVGERQ